MCWNARSNVESGRPRQDRRTPGIFGDYNCDSPWALIESAAKAMKSKHSEGIEFVLWTGDALSHSDKMSKELRLQCLKNLTDLLSRTFSEQFVFPALGHEDVGLSLKEIATLWKHWLPTDALQTFEKTGFYTIEQTTENYRIIFLNTNLWLETETGMDNRVNDQRSGSGVSVGNDNSDDPHGQWTWFDSTLRTARKKKEAVYVVGHTPPGVEERDGGARVMSDRHNLHYLQLVKQYSDIIAGQFFGHWHSDTFRTIYSDGGVPVSWIMMTPSVTPGRANGPNNPGLRLYKFETSTGKILDYTQFYLDLPKANIDGNANWATEYSLLEYYHLEEITPHSLHDLADRFTQTDDSAFVRYYAANAVSLPREVEEIWGCGALNSACVLRHYCAVTRVNPSSYNTCLASYAYALATACSPTVHFYLAPYLLLALLSLFRSR
ncbi:acid sphingomyelinase-like phosphodiesterase 3b isoform X3 [Venturia canescens]|nr:acid sphingomyelinase-like phosphodiesterase 3b isoform X3 [Venturia canescens]